MTLQDEARLMWVQFTHLEKTHGYLPGLVQAQPAIFAMSPQEYDAARAGFAERARGAALELLDDADFAADMAALPIGRGQIMLAVGDSLTDDLQGWAEILRHALEAQGSDVQVVNQGLSAHTTSMVLRRWPGTLRGVRPDWVVCGLGGNDVTRIGHGATKSQVSLEECVANLRELRRIATDFSDPSWVWMTPVPVDEDRVADFGPFRFGQSTWRNEDVVALRNRMRGFGEEMTDLVDVFGVPADSSLTGDDGVHPTLAGQAAITRAVVTTLSRMEPPTTPR